MANEENLKPFKTGYDPRREGNGRPKGRKSLATIIRELEDEEFDWDLIPVKDKDNELLDKYKKLGAPFRVIVFVALGQAASGDTKAMEWLRKAGYGDQIDVTTNGKDIVSPLVVSVIQPRDVNTQTETEASD